MSLSELKLFNFRNYRNLHLDLSGGITVFTGLNGIGKTTILEAISLLGSGRSFRNAKNVDYIKTREENSFIHGKVESLGLFSEIKIQIYPQGKKIYVDDKLAKSTQNLYQLLPTIAFSPSDHKIVEGDATDRKQFLNRAISNLDWEYTDQLTQYNKALQQRNRVLKDALEQGWSQTKLSDILAVWDEQLIDLGSSIMTQRFHYINALHIEAAKEYSRISQTQDQFMVKYLPFGEEEGEAFGVENYKNIFRQKLTDSMRRDLYSGSTQIGAHKDEILLILNANKVKFYGSQGEKRTCALALRLGELALFKLKLQKLPVLLFDDVSSELDRVRRQSLVELLRHENTQVFITATELPSSLMEDVDRAFKHVDLTDLGDRS